MLKATNITMQTTGNRLDQVHVAGWIQSALLKQKSQASQETTRKAGERGEENTSQTPDSGDTEVKMEQDFSQLNINPVETYGHVGHGKSSP